ncbi:unnamed protein product [Chrysoparadoxa australica]
MARARVSEEQRQDVQRCFEAFDDGSKGWMTKEDFKLAATALLGFRPTKYEMGKWVQQAGQELNRGCPSNGRDLGAMHMSRDCFTRVMEHRLALQDRSDTVRQMFKAFDIHCHGYLTAQDFAAVMKQVCTISEQRAAELFEAMDLDRSGRIGLKQFERIMGAATI